MNKYTPNSIDDLNLDNKYIKIINSYINSNKKSIDRTLEIIKAGKNNIPVDIKVLQSDIRNAQNDSSKD